MTTPSGMTQIGIIGGGKMGISLFNHLCKFNFSLVWYMRSNVEEAQNKYLRKLKRGLKNNLIDAAQFETQKSQRRITSTFNDLKNCSLIIECITEDLLIKKQLIHEVFKITKDKTIIASNSSSIMPHLLSDNDSEKARLIGLHFFYPVEIKAVAELVISESTSSDTIKMVQFFASQIKKNCLIQQQTNAFLLNRIMLKWQALAFQYCQQQNLSYSEIDAAVNRYLFPGGIFEMMDHIGLDTIFNAALQYSHFDVPTEQNVSLVQYLNSCIQKNLLGVKSNEGFHTYPRENNTLVNDNQKQIALHLAKSYFSIYNWVIENKLCTKNEFLFAINEYLDTDTSKWHNFE